MAEGTCESGFLSNEKSDGRTSSDAAGCMSYCNVDTDNISTLKERLVAACQNIEFLKKEHAVTLDGLHKEIEKLHNYIRNFQFQQNVLGIIVPDNEFFNCDIATLEQKVDTLIADNLDMKKRLQESNKMLERLDQKQSMERWQTQQELQEKEKTIVRLEKELEAKCSAISDLKLQVARKKKNSFLRRFSFNSESPSNVRSIFGNKCVNSQNISGENLKAVSLPAKSSPSHSLNCDYSSFSSLSDRSNSDDEFLRTPFLRKQYTFPSPKRGLRHTLQHRSLTEEHSFKLPPILGVTQPQRQLVRQQIRMDKLAMKTTLDSVAIDHVSLPELADKI